MTYLELCQETLRAASTGSPKALLTLRDADQYQTQVTRFVAEAWKQIQSLHDNWGWREGEFEAELARGVDNYAWNEFYESRSVDPVPSIARDPGFREWLAQYPITGVGSQWLITAQPGAVRPFVSTLSPYTWAEMRDRRIRSPLDSVPSSFAIRPDKRVFLHPNPDEPYVLHGRFIAGVQELSSEDHEPHGLPNAYQIIIVWRAVMMLHGDDESQAGYAFAAQQYGEQLAQLQRLYLPALTMGGSLA